MSDTLFGLVEKLDALCERWEHVPYTGDLTKAAKSVCAQELRKLIGSPASQPLPPGIQEALNSGAVQVKQNKILDNHLRRVELIQAGRIPTFADVPAGILPDDDRKVEVYPFMDDHGAGHLYIVWKLHQAQAEGLGGKIQEIWE